jgi:hypothetical protein
MDQYLELLSKFRVMMKLKRNQEDPMITEQDCTYSIELHFLWYSSENSRILRLNHSVSVLVIYSHPKNTNKYFYITSKRTLPLQIVFLSSDVDRTVVIHSFPKMIWVTIHKRNNSLTKHSHLSLHTDFGQSKSTGFIFVI